MRQIGMSMSIVYSSRSVNESTGYSPYFLMHGRHPRFPIGVLVGIQNAAAKLHRYPFAERITRALQSAFDHVRAVQVKVMLKNRRRLLGLPSGATEEDIRLQMKEFQHAKYNAGDLVLLSYGVDGSCFVWLLAIIRTGCTGP